MNATPLRPGLRLTSVTTDELLLYGELNSVDVCERWWWEKVPERERDFADIESGMYKDVVLAKQRLQERERNVHPPSWNTVVAYRPLFADILDIDAVTNLLLCQALHWDEVTKGQGFFHTREQWEADTRLTYTQQLRARRRLGTDGLGILEEQPGGRLNRIQYRLNRERFRDLLEKQAPGLLNEILPTLAAQMAGNLPTSWNESSQQLSEKSPTEEIYEERKEEIPPPPTPRKGGGGKTFSEEDGLHRKTSRSQPEMNVHPSRRQTSLIADMPPPPTEEDFEDYTEEPDDSFSSKGDRLLDLWAAWADRHRLHAQTDSVLVPFLSAFSSIQDADIRLSDHFVRQLNEHQVEWLYQWAEEAMQVTQMHGSTNFRYYVKVLKNSFTEKVSPLERDDLTRG